MRLRERFFGDFEGTSNENYERVWAEDAKDAAQGQRNGAIVEKEAALLLASQAEDEKEAALRLVTQTEGEKEAALLLASEDGCHHSLMKVFDREIDQTFL